MNIKMNINGENVYVDSIIVCDDDDFIFESKKRIFENLKKQWDKDAVENAKNEQPEAFKNYEIKNLKNSVISLKKELEETKKSFKNHIEHQQERWAWPIYEKIMQNCEKKLQNMQIKIKILEGKLPREEITPGMTERARQYPIERIFGLDSTKNLIKCISHDDKKPSMSIKNNFAYCFACGYHADTISVYRQLNNCGFKEAVMALQ